MLTPPYRLIRCHVFFLPVDDDVYACNPAFLSYGPYPPTCSSLLLNRSLSECADTHRFTFSTTPQSESIGLVTYQESRQRAY
ncbi:hypothetical protein INR49_028945 [Caranx melampygus]|nr:hypothetical protein INR49_028945 [Caranx melampygus]